MIDELNKLNKLHIIAPIPPSINNDYMKPNSLMKNGKPITIMYESSKAKKYKKEIEKIVKEQIKEQNFKVNLEKFVIVEWIFFFPRVNMDTNNYYKCFIDAITNCTNLIWKDDNITLMRDNRIYYDSNNPRVEVDIYYSDHIGIFDNQEDLDNFINNNCSQCKKGNKIGQNGGCSIYKKAMESRIQDEIDMKSKICRSIKRR